MHTISPPMKTLDISIAGEINLDLILYGLPEVMPVERELLGTDFQVTLGSSSAILAHNLAVLGTHVGFITLVGEDALGKVALERLGESGVDLSRVRVAKDGTATGVTLVLPHGTPRHILTYPGTMANDAPGRSGYRLPEIGKTLPSVLFVSAALAWSQTCRHSLKS